MPGSWFLPGGTSEVGRDDVGRVPVQAAAGTVIPHGSPGIGVRGGFLDVPERHPIPELARHEPMRCLCRRCSDPSSPAPGRSAKPLPRPCAGSVTGAAPSRSRRSSASTQNSPWRGCAGHGRPSPRPMADPCRDSPVQGGSARRLQAAPPDPEPPAANVANPGRSTHPHPLPASHPPDNNPAVPDEARMHPTISYLVARTRIAGQCRRAHRGALAQARRAGPPWHRRWPPRQRQPRRHAMTPAARTALRTAPQRARRRAWHPRVNDGPGWRCKQGQIGQPRPIASSRSPRRPGPPPRRMGLASSGRYAADVSVRGLGW